MNARMNLFKALNYLDVGLPIEKVSSEGIGGNITVFRLLLRLSEMILFFTINYLIVKFVQFVLSLLLNCPIEKVLLVYFVLPLEIIIELGLSKLDSSKPMNFLAYLLRASVKFVIIFLIDKSVVTIFT